MPTQSTTYNSRLTDEALEKRFRDTFRSQGGAELVDDLYASGVIVPVVDFTAAAEGSALRQDLQRAFDLATESTMATNATTTIINTTGFWLINVLGSVDAQGTGSSVFLRLTDGFVSRVLWGFEGVGGGTDKETAQSAQIVVFVKAGESVNINSASTDSRIRAVYRQIADVNGNLTNPSGFTFS